MFENLIKGDQRDGSVDKHLPHNHEDQSLNAQNPHKAGQAWWLTVVPEFWNQRQAFLGQSN